MGDVSIEATEQVLFKAFLVQKRFEDLIDLFEKCGEVEMICLQAIHSLRNASERSRKGRFGASKA